MKKLICIILSLMMLLGAAAFAEPAPVEKLFTPGTYSAEAQGIFVPVKVQITVSGNEITSVLIDATGETPELGGMAAGTLSESILNAQTPNVDALSGATVTSNAIISAATEALQAAGADIAVLDAQRRDTGAGVKEKEDKTVDTEIVIIGAGGAGMTAAIMTQQAGKDFVLLEKMPYAGGNTTKATGGMKGHRGLEGAVRGGYDEGRPCAERSGTGC